MGIAQKIYDETYMAARAEFDGCYQYAGYSDAMVTLWDAYCRLRCDITQERDIDMKRLLFVQACALWSLYVLRCTEEKLLDPELGIPF